MGTGHLKRCSFKVILFYIETIPQLHLMRYLRERFFNPLRTALQRNGDRPCLPLEEKASEPASSGGGHVPLVRDRHRPVSSLFFSPFFEKHTKLGPLFARGQTLPLTGRLQTGLRQDSATRALLLLLRSGWLG